MPLRAARRMVSRRLQARRMRTLLEFWHYVARRHAQVLALITRKRLLHEHPCDRVQRFLPLFALASAIDAKASQFGLRTSFSGAELHPSSGNQIERGDPFSDTRRVIELVRQLHDAVSQPDAFGALAGGGEKYFRRAGMRILLQEMMFHFPYVVKPQPVCQFNLIQGFAQKPFFGALAPRPRDLMLVEYSESHGATIITSPVSITIY